MAYPTDTGTSYTTKVDEVDVIHAADVNNLQTEISAIKTLLGIIGSAVTGTFYYLVSEITGSDKAVGKTATQTLTNKTLTSPVITTPTINIGSDSTGDIYYRNSGGLFKRLAIGTNNYILRVVGGLPVWDQETATINASTTVKGVSELATSAEITAGTATGGTGAALVITPDALEASKYAQSGYFGDGSDGNVTISSNTTLTTDMNYDNLTINSTFILDTAGYRIFVKGIYTNNGTIRNNGGNGGNGTTPGTAAASGTLSGGATGGNGNGVAGAGSGGGGGGIVFIAARNVAVQGTIQAIGGNGGNGSGVAGAPTNGNNGGTVTKTLIQTGNSGNGGNSGGGGNGGSGGSGSVSKASRGSYPILTLMIDGITQLSGGSGGGGGGSDASAAGGGGGGQGGVIIFIYSVLTTSGTLTVTGGTGGTGFNTGVSGSNGGSGISIQVQV